VILNGQNILEIFFSKIEIIKKRNILEGFIYQNILPSYS